METTEFSRERQNSFPAVIENKNIIIADLWVSVIVKGKKICIEHLNKRNPPLPIMRTEHPV